MVDILSDDHPTDVGIERMNASTSDSVSWSKSMATTEPSWFFEMTSRSKIAPCRFRSGRRGLGYRPPEWFQGSRR